MNAHVTNIARTCYFELHRLASIRRFLTSTATVTLVSAFILSRIDYCNSLLFGSIHDVTSHLQRIHNYAARVIVRLPKSSSITTYLKSLHWLPVKDRSTCIIACLCYHCHSSTANELPSKLQLINNSLILPYHTCCCTIWGFTHETHHQSEIGIVNNLLITKILPCNTNV